MSSAPARASYVSFMFIWQDFLNFKWHDEHHLMLHEKKYREEVRIRVQMGHFVVPMAFKPLLHMGYRLSL